MKEQRKAIRNLWMKSFISNKRRNFFVVLAILLTTLLITSVISLGSSLITANERQTIQYAGTIADANINDLTEQQYAMIKANDQLSAYGQQRTVGRIDETSLVKKKQTLLLHWYDESEWNGLRKEAITDFTGAFPKKEDEILVPLSALNALGIKKPKIGMTIPLIIEVDDEEQKQDFILSGYFKEFVTQKVPDFSYVLVSEAFSTKYPDPEKRNTVSVKYKQGDDLLEQNKHLAEQLKLSEYQEIKTTFMETTQNQTTVYLGVGLFALIILVSGGLLIYNVLYISIANDIRFFGLLKAIGTTGKQLRRIVINQALLLSVIGISAGLLLGWLLSFWLVPFALKSTNFADSVVVSTAPWIYISAAVFALITTLISSVKPAGVAAKVPPVLAIQFVETPIKLKKVRSKSGGKLYQMAWRNIFRDKKRAVTVILSMFLGITLFIGVNSAIDSMDFERIVLNDFTYDVDISATMDFEAVTGDGNEILAALENMEGISDLHAYLDETILVDYDAEKFSGYIDSYNKYFKYGRHDPKELNQKNFKGKLVGIDTKEVVKLMTDSGTDFDESGFSKGAFGLVQSSNPEDFSEIPTLDFTVLSTGEKQSVPVEGVIANDYLGIQAKGAPVIYVAKEAINQFTPYADMFSVAFNIEDEKEAAIISQLKAMIDEQPYFRIMSKSEMLEKAREEIMTFRLLGNTLAVVLALIGLLNFVNIITTSLIARKQELAILESIGMTRKQTNQVLAFEGFYYAAITGGLVLTIGSLVTIGLFQIVKNTAPMAVFSFPFLTMGLSLLLVSGLCIATPLVVMKLSGHQALADRIK
ncbi:ABC transporter permease [Enterococcus sp. BWM-S5]|uniref:ABC transporter permease n=1 Tax=Enterococcus larvae TaxID=2794352 RepID=A0ABS4CFZ3_9ENTE|nr:ABC transporter permease [Enterococcus larvae]MBP1045543.1 ABC transporter permease [Enterococcus larvae]